MDEKTVCVHRFGDWRPIKFASRFGEVEESVCKKCGHCRKRFAPDRKGRK